MARKLANKRTKEILPENVIKEKGLPKGEFTTNWNGRITILEPEISFIAKQLDIKKKGEYAIKVR
ncbi:MAG: hypothetical protein GXP63_06475 [DPANN group archaeon]|nr:hypothetical protein [DPANN group archaeon]